MNAIDIQLCGERLSCLGSGALWWHGERFLIVADMHLCKSERMARRGGAILPPYETHDTLSRLADDIAACDPATVLCLGDSFDDCEAEQALDPADATLLAQLQAGRRWVWATGNHDPAPVRSGGISLDSLVRPPLTFRHIARENAAPGEISGHYHPKACLTVRGKHISRRCFLHDGTRVILPAYGTYTGGLDWTDRALLRLFGPGACAILVGSRPHALPVPRFAGTH